MSLFEHISATDDSERISNRKSATVADQRYKKQFLGFLKGASSAEELVARWDLVEGDFLEMVASACEEHGGDPKKVESFLREAGPLTDAANWGANAVGDAVGGGINGVGEAAGWGGTAFNDVNEMSTGKIPYLGEPFNWLGAGAESLGKGIDNDPGQAEQMRNDNSLQGNGETIGTLPDGAVRPFASTRKAVDLGQNAQQYFDPAGQTPSASGPVSGQADLGATGLGQAGTAQADVGFDPSAMGGGISQPLPGSHPQPQPDSDAFQQGQDYGNTGIVPGMASGFNQSSVGGASPLAQRVARRPKMCPYHNELTDASLQAGEPQYAAFSGLVGGPSHCKGEFDGKCNFKPEMVSQSYWDGKQQEADTRKQEREQEAQEINSIPEADAVESPEIMEEGDGITDLDSDLEDAPSAVGEQPFDEAVEMEPMALAASLKEGRGYSPGDPAVPGQMARLPSRDYRPGKDPREGPGRQDFDVSLRNEEMTGIGLDPRNPKPLTEEDVRRLNLMREKAWEPDDSVEASTKRADLYDQRRYNLQDILSEVGNDPQRIQQASDMVSRYSNEQFAQIPIGDELAIITGNNGMDLSPKEATSVLDSMLLDAVPNRTARMKVIAEANRDGGGAVKHEDLPTGNNYAQGGPSPKMDKSKWTNPKNREQSNLKPIDADQDDSPNPTVQQTLWKIRPTEDAKDYEKEPDQHDSVVEQQTLPTAGDDANCTQKNINQDSQGGTFNSSGIAANPVTHPAGEGTLS